MKMLFDEIRNQERTYTCVCPPQFHCCMQTAESNRKGEREGESEIALFSVRFYLHLNFFFFFFCHIRIYLFGSIVNR